jgi:hypothetical protein
MDSVHSLYVPMELHLLAPFAVRPREMSYPVQASHVHPCLGDKTSSPRFPMPLAST